MRERIREAVELVSLTVMVDARRARGLPHPAIDRPADRAEFDTGVQAFLERLRDDVAPALSAEQRGKLDDSASRTAPDPVLALLAVQVALARSLPDYWQRFEETRGAYTAERLASGGEGRGLLRRLFGG